jgi:hypothetical protein
MHSAFIVLLGITAAIVYGIAHDQVTTRLCLEYFTVFHPPLFATTSPTLLALGWGVVATWWLGLTLGAALAVAARFGPRPPREVATLVRPVCLLLGATAGAACLAGLAGYTLTALNLIAADPLVVGVLLAERHALFMAAAWSHTASYLFAIVGGTALITDVWRSREAARRRFVAQPRRHHHADAPTVVSHIDTLVIVPCSPQRPQLVSDE